MIKIYIVHFKNMEYIKYIQRMITLYLEIKFNDRNQVDNKITLPSYPVEYYVKA